MITEQHIEVLERALKSVKKEMASLAVQKKALVDRRTQLEAEKAEIEARIKASEGTG